MYRKGVVSNAVEWNEKADWIPIGEVVVAHEHSGGCRDLCYVHMERKKEPKSSRTRNRTTGRVHKCAFTHWQQSCRQTNRRRECMSLEGRGSFCRSLSSGTVWWLDWNLFQFQTKTNSCSVIWELNIIFSKWSSIESSVTPAQPTLCQPFVSFANGVKNHFTYNWQWQIQIEQDLLW